MNSSTKISFPITSWAEEDRPREKLMQKGKSALSDAELIAILIRCGNNDMSAVDLARAMLHVVNNDLNELSRLTVDEFQKFKGIGEAKAVSIVSALELGRRRKAAEPSKRDKINSSQDLYDLMKPHLMDLIHEEFWIILLNRANEVLKKKIISTGGISGTVADPKLIFKIALENLACAVILVHNHPSGNKNPSDSDLVLTKKMREAGKLLEIPVLDHLIYTENDYYSFADEGRIL